MPAGGRQAPVSVAADPQEDLVGPSSALERRNHLHACAPVRPAVRPLAEDAGMQDAPRDPLPMWPGRHPPGVAARRCRLGLTGRAEQGRGSATRARDALGDAPPPAFAEIDAVDRMARFRRHARIGVPR